MSSVEAATLCGGVSCDSSQSAGQGSQHISHSASMMAFSSALLRWSCLGLHLGMRYAAEKGEAERGRIRKDWAATKQL